MQIHSPAVAWLGKLETLFNMVLVTRAWAVVEEAVLELLMIRGNVDRIVVVVEGVVEAAVDVVTRRVVVLMVSLKRAYGT